MNMKIFDIIFLEYFLVNYFVFHRPHLLGVLLVVKKSGGFCRFISSGEIGAVRSSGAICRLMISGDVWRDRSSGDVFLDISSGDVSPDRSSGEVCREMSCGDLCRYLRCWALFLWRCSIDFDFWQLQQSWFEFIGFFLELKKIV